VPITPPYAAIFAVLFFLLSVRTLRLRRSLQIPVGDAGNPKTLRAMRVHSNFAEYVPLTLLLVSMPESVGGARASIHILCLTLLCGRLCHAYGVSQISEKFGYRVVGMALTFTALMGAALIILVTYSWRALG